MIGIKGSQGSLEVFQGVPENSQWVSAALKKLPWHFRGFLSALQEVQGGFRMFPLAFQGVSENYQRLSEALQVFLQSILGAF